MDKTAVKQPLMLVSFYSKAYFHFQKYLELHKTDSCAICEFNKKGFEEQKPRYLDFLSQQRVMLALSEKDGMYKPKIVYKGEREEMRYFDSEQGAWKAGIKQSFKILNENLTI